MTELLCGDHDANCITRVVFFDAVGNSTDASARRAHAAAPLRPAKKLLSCSMHIKKTLVIRVCFARVVKFILAVLVVFDDTNSSGNLAFSVRSVPNRSMKETTEITKRET